MSRVLPALLLLAAPAGVAPLDGGPFSSMLWNIPFVGILLSIALLPLAAPRLWQDRHGTVAALSAAALLTPLAWVFGGGLAAQVLMHVALQDDLPLVLLLLAHFITGGGVLLEGHLDGTPATNTALLAAGTALARLMGTTGASVLLIRPVLRAACSPPSSCAWRRRWGCSAPAWTAPSRRWWR